jgi:hypothetical protein
MKCSLTKSLIYTASLAAFSISAPAFAEHKDVIGSKFIEGCTLPQYLPIVADFNKWGASYGYKAQIFFPLQNDDVETFYWVGTSKNAAAFGAAWDAWRDAQSDSSSTPAKLQARLDACSKNVSRNSYDAY